jgi:hypothetical protein
VATNAIKDRRLRQSIRSIPRMSTSEDERHLVKALDLMLAEFARNEVRKFRGDKRELPKREGA